MTMPKALARAVQFLRAGYPDGMPTGTYVPLLALMRRRLSDDEVVAVADGLMSAQPIVGTDVGVAITKITDDLPSPEDTERVTRRLAEPGVPADDTCGPRE
jgi:hypothetical protein